MAVTTLESKVKKPGTRQVPVVTPPVPAEMLRQFTVDEYHQMIANGVLSENDPFELLEGWIIRKMPIDPIHADAVTDLYLWLASRYAGVYFVRCQQPITSATSEPEPDVSIFPGPREKYRGRHPEPGEAEIIVEVANSSLAFDRGKKLQAYARMGVVQYWVVNLHSKVVEVYTRPKAGKIPGYKSHIDYAQGTDIPLTLGGRVIGNLPVSEFLA